MGKKTDVYKSVLRDFEIPEMKAYCKDMIELMPDYHFTIPSSTTMKYHNKTQCAPGGQSYHVLMVATIMNYLLSLDYAEAKFPNPIQRDCMRIATILHDSQKTGGGEHTVHEHPLLAQKWVIETHVEHDIDDKYKKYIGELIASHSGQWTTSKYSNEKLPAPQNDAQFFVHLCDILGSRSNLDMIYSDEQREAIEEFIGKTKPTIDNFVMPFGKHKDEILSDIAEYDLQYLLWLRDKSDIDLREPLKSLLDIFESEDYED